MYINTYIRYPYIYYKYVVLAGPYTTTCFGKYQSLPVKGAYNHELSLRILLHSIDTTANRYKRYIVPWLSISIDFYIRVFIRIYDSAEEVKKSALKRMYVYQSTNTPSFYIQPLAVMKPTPYTHTTHTTHTNNSTNTNTNTTTDNNNTSSVTNNTNTNNKNNKHTNTTSHTNTTINLDASITNAYNITPTLDLETGCNLKMGGPFWSDTLHDQSVVDELLRRIEEDSVGSNSSNTASSTATSSGGVSSAEEGSSTGGSGSGNMPYAIPTVDRVHGVLTTISEELKVSLLYALYSVCVTCLLCIHHVHV